MKPLSKSVCSILAISVSLIFSAAAFSLRSSESLSPAETKAAVTALTTKILESSQFAHQRHRAFARLRCTRLQHGLRTLVALSRQQRGLADRHPEALQPLRRGEEPALARLARRVPVADRVPQPLDSLLAYIGAAR